MEIGDAYVIRNAGGRASDDALRSLAACGHLASLRDDVETIRNSTSIPGGIPVSGYVYEVETGRLYGVVES